MLPSPNGSNRPTDTAASAASPPPPLPSPAPDDQEDEAALAMSTGATAEGNTVTGAYDASEEAALLADFDRFISTSDPAEPSSSSRQPVPSPSPSPRPISAVTTPLERLSVRYPHCDRDVLRSVLSSVQGDERAAVGLLRDSQAPTAGDAELADRLQRREQRRADMGDVTHTRNETVVPVNKGVMEQMVATLREIVVPALRAHFEELVLPDTRDESGGVEYELSEFQVSGLSLPPHNIVVKAAPDARSIRVNVVNIFLELEVGRWRYEGKGFVPLKDAGTARVTVHGMSVALTLEPRWSHAGGTKVVISDCTVTIDGVVRLKTQGAAADWAYNAIAVVLKPLVVSYVKEAVAVTVTKALAVHLSQWAFSRSLDEDSRIRIETHRPSAAHSPVTAAE